MAYDFQTLASQDILSERLRLELPRPALAPQITAYHLRNRDFLKPWNPRVRPEFYTLEFQQDKAQSEWQQHAEKRLLKFWLFKRQDPEGQEIIGHIAFSNLIWGGFRSCFLGYSVSEGENGKGYATEAIQRGVQILFETLRLHRVEANIMPRNKGSIRVVEKLGFECEGRSPKYLKINGVWEDHLHYVLRNKALE